MKTVLLHRWCEGLYYIYIHQSFLHHASLLYFLSLILIILKHPAFMPRSYVYVLLNRQLILPLLWEQEDFHYCSPTIFGHPQTLEMEVCVIICSVHCHFVDYSYWLSAWKLRNILININSIVSFTSLKKVQYL